LCIKIRNLKEIRKIIAKYEITDFDRESLAIATVVNIEESSYRRIGARMLVSSNGTWTGGISGGCLEGDALKQAQKAIFNQEPTLITYDTLDDDPHQIGIGLGCNGKIDVLFVPLDPTNENNPIELLKEIVLENKSAIMIQIIKSGHNSYPVGDTFLVDDFDHKHPLMINHEELLSSNIEEVKIKRRPQVINFNITKNQKIHALVEYLRPEIRIIIIGDNYDVMALVGIVDQMGWEIHIVGRKTKISKALFSKAKKIYEYESINDVPLDEYTGVILMTHDFDWDKKLLPIIIQKKPQYIGMLGPRKRWKKMQEALTISLNRETIKVHSPVGLDIGAETPEEIAISIISEMIAVFRQRNGASLRLKEGTIHERY